ncbi:MerR family transcriptional regulator [Actinomadura rayongensis]|uniref:MerR family transcriptional regulator n=1 Tax=Actinomadura rayongensis TaxID=1429076 RepID=A0A6I4WAT1_9ACTN|nr:MerR family transcriptional regulator [Actinomadura rayongensis]MXQ66768.1 MerR family transcriptional regulator [Actinomadura rayongensis]
MDETWTIRELAEHAAAKLAASASAQVNGRVRDLPNERLVRWYTTIGLLDPPLGRRGRVALYGRRHLLQLLAVKRRQAQGRTIAEIQLELTGATDATLERVAGEAADAEPETASSERERFWAARPDISFNVPARLDTSPALVRGVRLVPGLTLLLEVEDLDAEDLDALRAAAGPLLQELRRRGLLPEPSTSDHPAGSTQ